MREFARVSELASPPPGKVLAQLLVLVNASFVRAFELDLHTALEEARHRARDPEHRRPKLSFVELSIVIEVTDLDEVLREEDAETVRPVQHAHELRQLSAVELAVSRTACKKEEI